MKLRLSRALMIAVLVAGTYQAEATRGAFKIGSDYYTESAEATEVTVSTEVAGMNDTEKYHQYVKTGDGLLDLKLSEDSIMNSALFVREGAATVSNGNLTLAPVSTSSCKELSLSIINTGLAEDYLKYGASTALSIGGKNQENGEYANLTVSKARVTLAPIASTASDRLNDKGMASSIVVGSLDGNGKLVVENGAVIDNMKSSGANLIIGAVAKGKTNYYNAHVHETENYTQGSYEVLSGTSTKIGAGIVEVRGEGTTLLSGTNGVILGEGELNISDGAKVYSGHNGGVYAGDAPNSACGQADEWETSIGALDNASSRVNITNGGMFNTGVGMKIGSFDGANVTINVSGEHSKLEQVGDTKTYVGFKFALSDDDHGLKDKLGSSLGGWVASKLKDYMGYNYVWDQMGAASSTTNITISDSGTVCLQDTYLGHSEGKSVVNVQIGQESTMSTAKLTVEKGTTITNQGKLSATDSITLNGGKLVMQSGAEVEAAMLTIKSGATLETDLLSDNTEAVVFSLGVEEMALLDESSAATIDADLVLEDGAILNMTQTGIDLCGHALTVGDNVIINYTDTEYDGRAITLFTNVSNVDENAEFNVIVNGRETVATLSNSNIVVSIPEPTTATLSLLALAGLAARRRRK